MRKFEVVISFKDKFINLFKRVIKYSVGYDIESVDVYVIKLGMI